MIRQDHRGRFYRVVQFDNAITGQRSTVELPYIPVNAPAARMIPAPAEPQPRVRIKAKPVGPQAKRLHVLEVAEQGERPYKYESLDIASHNLMLHRDIKPLMRSPDCGKTWLPVEPVKYVWHVAYHLDEEQQV